MYSVRERLELNGLSLIRLIHFKMIGSSYSLLSVNVYTNQKPLDELSISSPRELSALRAHEIRNQICKIQNVGWDKVHAVGYGNLYSMDSTKQRF